MKIPKSELLVPGVECRTLRKGTYVVTSNETRSKFTLWHDNAGEFEKVTSAKTPLALYDKIPWTTK